jgi:uncharacterized protein
LTVLFVVDTIIKMKIEFDPVKNAENIRKHGVSMERAIDFVAMASIEDDRFDYEETRVRAYGHIDGVAHCIVFAIRNATIPTSLACGARTQRR